MQEVPSKPLSRECLREGVALGSSPLTPVRSQLEVAGMGRGEEKGERFGEPEGSLRPGQLLPLPPAVGSAWSSVRPKWRGQCPFISS